MQFLFPGYLWLLLLGLIPVLLYLFRRKSKKVDVSTLVFFKTLAKEHQESAWLRRLKKLISFLITMAIICAAILALARLVFGLGGKEQVRSIVILLDRSASMAVVDEDGTTRLDEAKQILRERLKQVPQDVGVSLVAYDVRPDIVQPRTLQRRELISRLEGLQIRPMADARNAAWETAQNLARLETPSVIWHVSDQSMQSIRAEDTELPIPENVELKELNLALDSVSNPAITAFQIRPVSMEYSRYEAYVQVALNEAAPEPVQARLNVHVGGMPAQFREIDLQPGERGGYTFEVAGAQDQLLRLELKSEQDDFPLDNQVMMPLPEARPILAAWIRPDETEDPFTRFALSSIQDDGNLQLLKGSPKAWPLSEKVDAVIFDGWLPEEWPENLPVIVINPPGLSGPVAARKLDAPIPYDSVRVGNEDHPVLFRVESSRVAVTQESIFQAGGSLEPLWIAGKEPVLAAGEYQGNRVVVMGFSPGVSERLPFTASFPLLVGNSLLWCVEGAAYQEKRIQQLATGEFADVKGEQVTWKEWREGREQDRTLPVSSDVIEMNRIGVWETDSGNRGTSHIQSIHESNIPSRPDNAGDASDYFSVKSGFAGNLVLYLIGLILLLLLLESWLFHRHAVY